MINMMLNNGVEIPVLGMGCFAQRKDDIINAIQLGYRHFDAAIHYGNELEIGEAIKESGIPRSDFFLTTKVMRPDIRERRTKESFYESLLRLKTDYIDLLLIHFPPEEMENVAWADLEGIYYSGKARAIGVSNYSVDNLKRTLENSSIIPMVNQIKINPYEYNQDLIDYCKCLGIVIEGYSPLGGNRVVKQLLENPILINIASKYEKKVSQIVIRWQIQKGFITFPKTSKIERMKDNIDVFSFNIEESDMMIIDDMRVCKK